jgi:uncharacterized membrane protein required for colicin V production
VELISQFTIADLAILVSLAGGVLVGFQQGLLRYILNCVAVLVAFILASLLRDPIADTLGSVWTMGTPDQQALWIYLILLAAGIIGGWVVVRIIRQLDEIGGALVGVLWVALIYTLTLVALDTFFLATDDTSVATMLGPIYEIMNESFILSWFREWLLPIVSFILRPFVPSDIATFLAS